MRIHQPAPSTVEELTAIVLNTSDQLNVKDIDKHILSYLDHVEAILAVKRGHNRF